MRLVKYWAVLHSRHLSIDETFGLYETADATFKVRTRCYYAFASKERAQAAIELFRLRGRLFEVRLPK